MHFLLCLLCLHYSKLGFFNPHGTITLNENSRLAGRKETFWYAINTSVPRCICHCLTLLCHLENARGQTLKRHEKHQEGEENVRKCCCDRWWDGRLFSDGDVLKSFTSLVWTASWEQAGGKYVRKASEWLSSANFSYWQEKVSSQISM